MKCRLQRLRFFAFFFAVLLPGVNIFAQDNPSTILDNYFAAIGGKKEFSKIQNIYAVADCKGPNGKYTTEIYSANNARLIFKQVRQNGEVYQGQTNGKLFWTKDEKTGDLSLAGRREAFVWRSHDFQKIAVSVDEFFSDLIFAGAENFAEKPAVKLRGKDELGNEAELFFDPANSLMLGFTIQNPLGDRSETIRIVFNEWKKTGALKLPSKVTATDRQGDFVLDFREISVNKIDEKIFAVPTRVTAMKQLFELHEEARAAHFQRDAMLLVSGFADGFTEVGNGKIRKPSRQASLDRFQNYFSNSAFLEWDDVAPPVIRVSDDATLGYIIVQKKVRLLAKNETGAETEETEIFAWLAVYRKIKGAWKLAAIASTGTPEKEK